MGWDDSHVHTFMIGNKEYGLPYPEFGGEVLDKTQGPSDEIFKKEKQRAVYTYDFGDNWEHDILFERRAENQNQETVLLKGKRACPPEDCGGIWGYENLL